MSDPLNPNFKSGVGRLVTDRFDFQDHVDGYRFRHKASAIDLFPTVVINSDDYTNVQNAIEALAQFVSPPNIIINDATPFVKGIIKLDGDIDGTADSVTVTGLQNRMVSNLPPIDKQVLAWSSRTGSWTPTTLATTFLAAGDISGNNRSQTVIGIQGRSVQNVDPSNNQALIWNTSNTSWQPTTFMPTGTGFAHVTSGVIDVAATGNIRYAGGKFQTDVNIQFNNAGITGDLSWTPTSINKTLTLPDITDTLVALTTTDTLINKTINATNNTITDTSTALGDLLKSNGTSFVRFAKGTPLQVLRVNADGTDLEYATLSSGRSSSGAPNTIQTSDGFGNFIAANDVLAGADFISIGTNPATVGTIRLPYAVSDKILTAKDSGNTDREIISRISADQYQIGPFTPDALNIQFVGGNLNFLPVNQFNIQTYYGSSPSFTVSGVGQVTINANTFQGLRIDLNGISNGPIAQFFGGVTGVAAGSSNYIAIGNSGADSLPSGIPSGGGCLYVEAGALKWLGSHGNITTIAPP